jgi:putative membrane protein
MMYPWTGWSFFGMHPLWWMFWLLLFLAMFSFAKPVSRRRARAESNPLAILQRRYASGELTTAEYEERKARLERDIARHAPSSIAEGDDSQARHAS